jgi:DNA-binding CsgD family transcriptional regulator
MKSLEFYNFGDELWCIYPDGRNERVTESSKEIIHPMLERIREFYPKAYAALERWYQKSSMNVPYYQYLIVKRFCKCNFGNLDGTSKDIDHTGVFRFERVDCPMRGECALEGIVCNPEFDSHISAAEMRVMKLLYEGRSVEETAEELYLSQCTVANHRKSVYYKLGIHDMASFVRYANEHNLFKE